MCKTHARQGSYLAAGRESDCADTQSDLLDHTSWCAGVAEKVSYPKCPPRTKNTVCAGHKTATMPEGRAPRLKDEEEIPLTARFLRRHGAGNSRHGDVRSQRPTEGR